MDTVNDPRLHTRPPVLPAAAKNDVSCNLITNRRQRLPDFLRDCSPGSKAGFANGA
jgi:hypothetical protein